MFSQNQKELIAFLAESALDAATRAQKTSGRSLRALLDEAEELMTIRTRLMNRTLSANTNQLELPLQLKKAA